MSKDDVPGFLSKVARFVRNPLTNWSDLNQAEGDKESGYSKAMLKEMIERKRRNDFVRKREFDQLRKLRSRGLMDFDPAERPSFFQSSLPSTPDERAVTLRKIDEIEAQMSQQWWKSKSAQDSVHSASSRATQQSSLRQAGGSLLTDASRQFDPTQASALRASGGASLAPVVVPGFDDGVAILGKDAAGAYRAPSLAAAGGGSWQSVNAAGGAAAAAAAAPIEPGFVHDPELEEAAIRFANGDHEGAEAALRALIAPGTAGIERSQTWLTLFDLYRATGQHDRFDNIAIDFANRFGRSAPVWFAMSDSDASPMTASAPLAAGTPRGFSWSAPDRLSVKAVSALTTALAKAPEPWRINWSRMTSIEDEALEPLLRLVEQWCGSAVQLRFVGADQLDEVLAESTPSADRTVNPVRWRVRMEFLRLMGRADTFDLVALDYCITYEVSPPSWTDSLCLYRELNSDGVITGFQSLEQVPVPADTVPHGEPGPSVTTGPHTLPQGMYGTQQAACELSGQLVGDAGDALKKMTEAVQGGKTLIVRCDKLARVDFSAAGSVLNWVAARQADGCQVQFDSVQRLVAVFFNVIGINEHAKVTARQN